MTWNTFGVKIYWFFWYAVIKKFHKSVRLTGRETNIVLRELDWLKINSKVCNGKYPFYKSGWFLILSCIGGKPWLFVQRKNSEEKNGSRKSQGKNSQILENPQTKVLYVDILSLMKENYFL